MDAVLRRHAEIAGPFAVLLTADMPSPCQQRLCGVLEWDIKLDQRPEGGEDKPAAAAAGQESRGGNAQPAKKQKSQRRLEKEQEYYERQQRMHEAQKAKADAMKRTKCRFYAQGRCKEGASCRFGHD